MSHILAYFLPALCRITGNRNFDVYIFIWSMYCCIKRIKFSSWKHTRILVFTTLDNIFFLCDILLQSLLICSIPIIWSLNDPTPKKLHGTKRWPFEAIWLQRRRYIAFKQRWKIIWHSWKYIKELLRRTFNVLW